MFFYMQDQASLGDAIRLLVVDDHDLFRRAMVTYLGSQVGIDVVGEASGGRAGVRLASDLSPDVVLLDLRMPDMDGTDCARAILKSRPATRIVALTIADRDEDIAAMLQAGACAFLVKDSPIEDVVAAVRAAATGAAWLSPRAAEAVLTRIRRAELEPESDVSQAVPLSRREIEVLRLIVRGLENAQIAEALGISPRTAKNHVSSILTKLGVPNRIQAAVYAVRHDLD